MFDRPNCMLAAAALGLTLLSAPALAQESLDGYYQGTLVCEKMPMAPGILRAPLDMILNGNAVIFARPVFNINGTRVLGSEIATGSLSDGTLHLISIGGTYGARYQAEYTGTISGHGGTLTGTQSWSFRGSTRQRACVAAFVKVQGPHPAGTAGSGPNPESEVQPDE